MMGVITIAREEAAIGPMRIIRLEQSQFETSHVYKVWDGALYGKASYYEEAPILHGVLWGHIEMNERWGIN